MMFFLQPTQMKFKQHKQKDQLRYESSTKERQIAFQ